VTARATWHETWRDALAPLVAKRLARCADGLLRSVAERIASDMLDRGWHHDRVPRVWRHPHRALDPRRVEDLADEIAKLALERAAVACDFDTLLDEPIGPRRR
jgi:phage terminase Nu1 subunit (DNA packaging protein)